MPDGYAVFDDSDKQVSPANVWTITLQTLEKILRKEHNI